MKRQLHLYRFGDYLLDFFWYFLKITYFNKTSLRLGKCVSKKLKLRHFSSGISVSLSYLFGFYYAVCLYFLPLPVMYFLPEHLLSLCLSIFWIAYPVSDPQTNLLPGYFDLFEKEFLLLKGSVPDLPSLKWFIHHLQDATIIIRIGLHRLVGIRLFRNGMRPFCSANPAV